MIRTIIIDDEYNASEFLEKMLQRYFPNRFYVCQRCESIDEAIKAIEIFQPQLVFLDIQMPNKNGFELFQELKEINFEVIFTTAHSEFAIEAIKQSALDYLLKPINYIDLLGAITRFDNKLKKENQQQQLNVLLENLSTSESAHRKLAITTDTGIEFLKLNSIIYLEAQNNYTKIYSVDKSSLIVSKTLKSFEESLPNDLFFRVHKTYLVNMNYIKRFTKVDDFFIELITGGKLPVSIRKKDEFITKMSQKSSC